MPHHTPLAPPATLQLKPGEFERFQQMIHQATGIWMSPAKQALVAGRLARRLHEHGLSSFDDYFQLLVRTPKERQVAIDLLTTNETHFFREPRHFQFLQEHILPQRQTGHSFRVWSAAASTGQEPYSIAMILSQTIGLSSWEVLGSDVSTRVLARARSGVYDLSLAAEIPPRYLNACCLKGVGSQTGTFMLDPGLARRVSFAQVNLIEPLPDVGQFDVIFLRNVMIYFQEDTKRLVVNRLLEPLRPGGWLIIGLSESLTAMNMAMDMVAPSIYQKR